jgi:hypothetical protein
METKQWFFRAKYQTTLFLSGFLLLSGCQRSQYTPTENDVYHFASSFKSSIPKDFQKEDNGYHELGEDYKKQKGRFVALTPSLMVGYADRSNPGCGTVFLRGVPEDDLTDLAEEIIILFNGENATVYLRQGIEWKKGNCTFEVPIDDLMHIEDCLKSVIESGQKVDATTVNRYVKLADRFKKTYFSEQKN